MLSVFKTLLMLPNNKDRATSPGCASCLNYLTRLLKIEPHQKIYSSGFALDSLLMQVSCFTEI